MTETEAPDTGDVDAARSSVQNTGTIHVPVDVELRFADGDRRSASAGTTAAATARGRGSSVERSAQLVEVRLDPDGKLRSTAPVPHDYRLDGDGARVAARGGAGRVVGADR